MKLNNFKEYEFVGEESYELHGDKCIQEMDKELLVFIDALHPALSDHFGQKVSIIINDWKWGGQFSARGLRTPNTFPYAGSIEKFNKSRSQHKYGKALDFDVYVGKERIDPEIIIAWIIHHRDLVWVQPVSFIESGVNWVHVDTRPIDNNALVIWDLVTEESTLYK